MPRVHLPDGRIVNFPDGMPEADITKAMAEIAGPSEPAAPVKSVGGFLGNVASSGGRFLKDTATGMWDAVHYLGDLSPGNPNAPDRYKQTADVVRNAPGIASAAGSAIKKRYGGMSEIGNTLYNDPVGVLSDISTVMVPAKAGLKAGGLTKLAKIAGVVGEATNPMRAVGAIAEPIAHGAARSVVRSTLRAPAAVREDFGGGKAVADAVLKDRVFSEASAGRKLDQSVAKADQMLADAQASGTAGVPRRGVADAVIGKPRATADLRARLGDLDAPAQSDNLMASAKAILRRNPKEIPLTDAQAMKREAQALAYEAGSDNKTIKKSAEVAKAQALRSGIEDRVPSVGPVNEQSQRLLGSKLAFGAAEERPRALTNFLSMLGFAGGGPVAAGAMKAIDSPRLGALTGIGIDTAGKAVKANATAQAALIARLLGQE